MNDKNLLVKLGCRADSRNDEKYQTVLEELLKISKELKKNGVTLKKLWKEYIKRNPTGYQYTQFCRHYSE